MTGKTKTVVVIEHHEQTVIRRTRRTMSSGESPIAVEPGALARPLARSQAEPVVREKRQSLGACLKTVVTKSAPWLRRMKARFNERKNRLSMVQPTNKETSGQPGQTTSRKPREPGRR